MDLQTIRHKTAYSVNNAVTLKAVTRDWIRSLSSSYTLALTLTLKQTLQIDTALGTVKRKITLSDAQNIAQHFIKQLNREYFKSSAKRHNKTLKYIVICEGTRSYKNLHLHLLIGDIKTHRLKEMAYLIDNAKTRVHNIDREYKVDIAGDTGWAEYITKEVGKDTDNIFWDLLT